MKTKKKSRLTTASSKQIDDQLHRISFREIKILCAVLQDLSAGRLHWVRARFNQDGLHFADVMDFLAKLGVLELTRGQVRRIHDLGKTEDEIKSALIQRLFERSTPYQSHINDFTGHFQRVGGNVEIVMDLEKRQRFSGIRNMLLDLEFLEQEMEKPRYWISPQYLEMFFQAKCRSFASPGELAEILRARTKLGWDAELEILKYEALRLRAHPPLAKQIRHIAAENISAGYDILSFTETASGTDVLERLIEVKAVPPVDFKFYWSRNEIEVARVQGEKYFLYLLPVAKGGFNIQGLRIIRNPFKAIYLKKKLWFRQDELTSFWRQAD